MTFPLNPLVRDTAAPAILETRAWLGGYDGAKGPAIDLSQAAPPYAPPPDLLARLAKAAGSPDMARYGLVPGEPDLRDAYAEHLSQLYDGAIAAEEVSITAGCNQAFLIAAMLIAQRGDALILPAPWYFNHKMTLDMLGVEARPLACTPASGFLPDPARAEALIDASVRALVLVTPNNPTGAVYPSDLIAAFAALCRKRGIWLILDETYRDFLPEGVARPHALLADGVGDGVLSLYSFSKSFALPGHRLSAMTHPAGLGPQIVKIQDCVQICPARPGQAAVAWGLRALGEWREEKRRLFNAQARSFAAAMERTAGWRIEAMGAYFAYLRHPHNSSALDVAKRLAVDNGLLMIPGSFFGPGQDAHMRASFGNLSPEALADLPRRFGS